MGVGKDVMEKKIMYELNDKCHQIDKHLKNRMIDQNANNFFDLIVGSITNNILVGYGFDENNKNDFLHIKSLLDKVMEVMGIVEVMFPLWIVRTFFWKRYKFIMDVTEQSKTFLAKSALKRYEDMKSGKYTIDPDNFNDFADAFLFKMEHENKNGGNPVYTIESMKNIMIDLWIAGQETTTTTLTARFILLLHNREIMSKFLMRSVEETRRFVSRDALKRYEDVKRGKYRIDPDNLNDYVDAFLYKMEQEDKNGGNPVYTIESLQETLIDLWIAGQEPTATTLIVGFIQLFHNREIMDKVRDELMVITGNGGRSLSLKDKNMTPLLNATIGEIQRHASILNLNFWKVNHELTYINGQPVDANTLITSQLSAIHTNGHIFDNPHLFDPMRFIRNDQLLQQIIPFGVGKRSCLGESLARAELYLILGNLLLRYDFQPIGQLPSTKEIEPYGFAKRPHKFSMKFIKL